MAKSLDSPQFRQRGQLGAYTSSARAEGRTVHTLPGRRALIDKLENGVDSESRLTIQERAKRAEYPCTAHMQRIGMRAEQVRRGRRQP